MSGKSSSNSRYINLIIGLCLLVFFNISCFTIITSFTKSNFLTAIQLSPVFGEVYNQKPYFFLYGFSSTCFVFFYLFYHSFIRKSTFERRIKRDIQYLIGCSTFLYLIPLIFPDFHRNFFPAAVYFVVYDILDDLIIVQTWTLINYSINIRESKKVQYLFLFSGGLAAFISGQYIVGSVSGGNQTFFLLLVIAFSFVSLLIVSYIFSTHRSRILASISAEKVGLKSLLDSQKKYKVIKSIILITVIIGIFNLFFKVLFDTQINARYSAQAIENTDKVLIYESSASITPDYDTEPDPKTNFIGKYKAIVSLLQVFLQLVFIYFFSRLWLNGRILFSYPLLLIPNMVFLLLVYFSRGQGFENLLFWGTILACSVNELIRRVIFDSAYQMLMFSIPERLCNALRMYTRLFIKPLVVILICSIFVIMPVQEEPIPLYCSLLLVFLFIMIFIVTKIPRDYVASLKKSVARRISLERPFDCLLNHGTNYIIEQYEKVVSSSYDRFGYLYILNMIKSNYSPDLDFVLEEMLKKNDMEVVLETVHAVKDSGALALRESLESLLDQDVDIGIKESVLKAIVEWGPSSENKIKIWMENFRNPVIRKYVLAVAYYNFSNDTQEKIIEEVRELLDSHNREDILSAIWLVGELKISKLSDRIQDFFDITDPDLYRVVLTTASKLGDFDLFKSYIKYVGYDRIIDYETLNKNLASFGERSFGFLSDLLMDKAFLKFNPYIGKCLNALRYLPSQNSIDFLIESHLNSDTSLIRIEALKSLSKIKQGHPELDFSRLLDALPDDIERCVKYCLYFKAIYSSDTDKLLLVELARNIEYEIWIVFKILDMFYPDLAIFDSYYRIMQSSHGEIASGLIRAKSIEYLESLIKDDHYHFLRILESISFEDGFLSQISSLPLKKPVIEDVYDKLISHGYYWLRVSAILDMPPSIQKKYEFLLKENEEMIPVLEKIQFLKRVSLFKGFSVMELFLIAQITREVAFESGHKLFKIGDPGDALYIILEGTVEIVNEAGESLAHLEAPQCFGEVAVLDKSGRSANAICNEECQMLMITTEDFHEILEGYPVLYKNIISILTGWLRKDSRHSGQV